MAEVTLQALEEEERSLAVGLEALELEYAALHQNTTFMEQQLETQQVLLYALTGHRQVRPSRHVTGWGATPAGAHTS
jgi:hypothetical protein